MQRPDYMMATVLFLSCIVFASWASAGTEPAESADSIQPLLIGAKVPKLTLATPQGGTFDLNAAIEGKPTVLIFYRGGW